MSDDRPVTGFDPPIGGPEDDDPGSDDERETEWNWPFIGFAVAVTLALAAVAVVLTLRDDDPPTETTTTTTIDTTTTQLSARSTIAELLPLDTQFATLLELAEGSEVLAELDGDGPITLLAPDEAALEDQELPQPGSDAADALLARHVLNGTFTTRDLTELDGSTVTTLGGDELVVEVGEDRSITIGGATVIKRQIAASNGVIYVTDGIVSA